MQETWVPSLGREDPLEKGTSTHSSILAWRIPWTEEPGGLQATGLQKMSDTTERLKQQQIFFRPRDNYSHLVLLLSLFVGKNGQWRQSKGHWLGPRVTCHLQDM